MECKNCGSILNGVYCAQCGQHSRVDKLNFSNFAEEVSETVFQVNRGFFKTLIDLFCRPGYAIKDYLEGKRKEHFKPLAYALTLSTVYFLITRFLDLNTFFGEAVSGFNQGYEEGFKGDFKLDLNLILDNYAIITILLIPFYALSMFIAFVNKGYNFLEHIAIRSFVVGQQAIIYLFFSLLIFLFGENDFLETIPIILTILYVFWVNIQLFRPNKTWKTILRTILFYFLLAILINILLAISSIALLVFFDVDLK